MLPCLLECPNAASLVERLSQAVARLLRGGALHRLVVVGARVVQYAEPQDRQSPEAEPGRFGERRAGRHGRPGQRLPGRQGPVRHGRGQRPRGAPDREHQDAGDRDLRAGRRDRRDLPRQPLLSGTRRQDGRGGLRRDPRGDGAEEGGRHRPRRAEPARAPADAAAARARHAGDDAALSLRGAAGRRIFRGHRRAQGGAGDARHRPGDHRPHVRFLRAHELRRPLRGSRHRHAAGQAGRPELRRARDGRARQRRRHHGGAEEEPAGGRRPPAARAEQEARRGGGRTGAQGPGAQDRSAQGARAEAGGGIASRRSCPGHALPRRSPARPDARAPRPAGARAGRQAGGAAGRARDGDRLRPFGRGPGARRRPRDASGRPAGRRRR